MANPTPDWDDFYDEGLGPDLPLSAAARQQLPSGVLPSGEANSFDFRQHGSGINSPFPYPNQNTPDELAGITKTDFPDQFSDAWWQASGALKTYGPDEGTLVDTEQESGIFHFNNLISRFSSASGVNQSGITDFTIFNNYVHHQRLPSNNNNADAIEIPFVSTYRTSIDFNAYNGQQGFGG
jgi:hypothetical protein